MTNKTAESFPLVVEAAQARQCFSHEKIGAVPPAQHMPEKAQMNSATFSSFAGQITSNEEMAQVGLLK